ncbi:glycoside hydrolase [Microdochium trichocladiopsis]|uniref:Mannan endo-1,6-alpha-mannosidase n=1 Tax=Microdochium trichocladiopsis TaxID=1682393 RepID=A0A9P8YCN1_9PEZI|nr:glycoside hydrolase [Microdochium trichocladiopsis]KAH7035500.1 glycoside hydrolase [Microdochium trichocladiopsis]
MPLIKSVNPASVVSQFLAPSALVLNDVASIHGVVKTIARDTMSYYSGNVTMTPETIAVFPAPHYWWQAGAAWGSMLDYSHYTGDSSYDETITQALLSQVGPKHDFMVPLHYGSEGNDDQAFWSFAILDAAERNFPQPDDSIPPWLTIAENIWNTMAPRWDMSSCGGGLNWQIFPDNPNGMNYKNSVANGGFFLMSARLARATGNQTYVDWANKVYDWSAKIGLIDAQYNVYDGAGANKQCTDTNQVRFTYTQGIYTYGAAVMNDVTGGSGPWGDRTQGLLNAAKIYFGGPNNVAPNVMWEPACEAAGVCNYDMTSFKAYMSRFLWNTAQMMPSTRPAVEALLKPSAMAAAKACAGGDSGTACGHKWYTGGFDGQTGLGEQMTALETIQGLLSGSAAPPLKAGQIKHVKGTRPPPPQPSGTEGKLTRI